MSPGLAIFTRSHSQGTTPKISMFPLQLRKDGIARSLSPHSHLGEGAKSATNPGDYWLNAMPRHSSLFEYEGGLVDRR